MSKDKNTTGSSTTITTTNLPGIDNSKVIPSSPEYIMENDWRPSKKRKERK